MNPYKNEKQDLIIGAPIFVGVAIVILSMLGAFMAIATGNYLGAGLLLIAAGIPTGFAIKAVLSRK